MSGPSISPARCGPSTWFENVDDQVESADGIFALDIAAFFAIAGLLLVWLLMLVEELVAKGNSDILWYVWV